MRNARTLRWVAMFGLWLCSVQGSAQTPKPTRAPEADWVSLSGTVVSTQSDAFRLDYGKGIIRVVVGDWAWLRGGADVIANHRVVVYGRVDRSEQDRQRLEAAGIYDLDLGTYFDLDRETADDNALWTVSSPLAAGYVEVAGRVIGVNGREILLNSGTRVDTRELPYDPLDDQGYPQIELGDRIKASGYLAKDILQGTEVVAAWIVELSSRDPS